ncbi:tRNA lysidine(34) synthetase TilS [Candidatus Nardonella dryophthoridicola]|uniref:tRNA(Ile)-lysidine synthase n=1 Tax=endosymbiont of Rhynchophorus ferrugineus TaxID=1972133 RepID=A0A2Z5T3L8_9GAMM|nr:tRNA lysidine(34) synthetase TilS [Candidatus Nardonella dryophthoridicola]BBA84988.1 tRNA(Ile)-lysidine synthase [endosymbiont of Rhynchophorus ferrugineus]
MKLLLNNKNNKKIYNFEKDINDKILYIYNKYNINNFLISFSGGLDSKFLLKLFINIKYKLNNNIFIKAIHINHNVNYKSKIWEKECIDFCNKNNILIYVDNIYIKNRNNLENNLRILRYNKIKKYINKNEFLITGHHKNDKIESFFLFLKRGSFIGLSSIKEIRKVFGIKIFSPLLIYTKKNIIFFSKILNIKRFIIDNSNFNLYYDRNFIRYKLIKLLVNKWPNIIYKICKTIDIFSDNLYFIKYLIKKNFKNRLLLNNKYILLNNIFYIKSSFYLKMIILKWLKILNLKYTFNFIINIYNILIKNSSSTIIKNKIFFIYKDIFYYTNKYNKFFLKKYEIIINYKNLNKIINIDNKIKLPYNIGFLKFYKFKKKEYNLNFFKIINFNKNDLLKVKFDINIKKKYFFIKNNKKKKISIKEIYKILNIPLYIRNKIPFIFINNKLLYMLNYFYNKNYNKNKNLHNIIYVYYKLNINDF